MSNIKFFQNEEEQACVVELGNRTIVGQIKCDEDGALLILTELEHAQSDGESIKGINPLEDKKIYLHFNDLESIRVVMDWMQTLKAKFIDTQINGL